MEDTRRRLVVRDLVGAYTIFRDLLKHEERVAKLHPEVDLVFQFHVRTCLPWAHTFRREGPSPNLPAIRSYAVLEPQTLPQLARDGTFSTYTVRNQWNHLNLEFLVAMNNDFSLDTLLVEVNHYLYNSQTNHCTTLDFTPIRLYLQGSELYWESYDLRGLAERINKNGHILFAVDRHPILVSALTGLYNVEFRDNMLTSLAEEVDEADLATSFFLTGLQHRPGEDRIAFTPSIAIAGNRMGIYNDTIIEEGQDPIFLFTQLQINVGLIRLNTTTAE